MRQDVFDKLMGLPVSYFDRNQAGDIISRVSYDIDVVTTSPFRRFDSDSDQRDHGGRFVFDDVPHLTGHGAVPVRNAAAGGAVYPLHGQKKPVRSMPGAARPTAR